MGNSERGGSVCHHDDCPPYGCMRRSIAQIVTEALDKGRLIAAQPADICEFCDKDAELRPYGPKGERICFDCGMKDEAAMRRGVDRRLRGQ
jgi:hypothetical protein